MDDPGVCQSRGRDVQKRIIIIIIDIFKVAQTVKTITKTTVLEGGERVGRTTHDHPAGHSIVL